VQEALIATDSDKVLAEIESAIGSSETRISRVKAGRDVRGAVIELEPDIVILDLQIGSMGGIAACHDLRLEEGARRLPTQKVLLLLDRDADVFLARRSDADGWLLKPLDARRIEKAVATILAGGTVEEGPALVEA
jgi:DNA-binding NarL/FixJ family response regulator